MATPYLQMVVDDVPSTQDLARSQLGDLPLVVIAPAQSKGRGRSGAEWQNADRSVAVSVAWRESGRAERPHSLIAGVAAVRSLGSAIALKWPNDIFREGLKVGGILVERSGGVVVAGMGVNLFWDDPADGAGSLQEVDPGPQAFREYGSLWAAELMALVDDEEWPVEEYRRHCITPGQEITWEPAGRGRALGIAESGALQVETTEGVVELTAGEIRQVRPTD